MNLPKRMWAWRYASSTKPSAPPLRLARGAWDDRKSEVFKSDVEYIRADIHEAEIARLRALLAECADDLSGRVGNDWPEMSRAKYPSIEAKYRRDMDIVYRARATLGDSHG